MYILKDCDFSVDSITRSNLDSEVQKTILWNAFLTRVVEERLLKMYDDGKLFGTVHTCIGQEFSGATVAACLRDGDAIFSNHRCHGHFISFTRNVQGLIAEIMGKETGICGGRGGSQHLCSRGFCSNGIQGGIIPVALGKALARKLNGDKKISVVFIGDGTLGEGTVYECLNIASKWALPLLVVLENNGYAQSTQQRETLAGEIEARAAAFGIRTAKGDTWNWETLYSRTNKLIDFVRDEGKPAFLQIDTYRLKAHSKGDDDRPRSELSPFEEKDPLNQRIAMHDLESMDILKKVTRLVDEAVDIAESSAYSVEELTLSKKGLDGLSWMEARLPRKRVVVALNEAFKSLMKRYPGLLFIGEDIRSPYGGAFNVSDGLSDLFPERVLNTPISEAAIVGMGCGAAMEGYKPVVEIMFGDFMTLTFDQILNHAAKFSFMYNHQVKIPLIIRTPMGGGRGYGPTHSQTLDRHFMGIPGLRILALNNLVDPGKIYDALLEVNEEATLVIENKLLYSQFLRSELPSGFYAFDSNELFPSKLIKPDADEIEVTLLGYGGLSEMLVNTADRLFEDHDIVAQVICPTQIYPLDIGPLLNVFSTSRFIVLVEEGQGFAGFGAEIIAQLAEHDISFLEKTKRMMPSVSPIPASRPLEQKMLPNIDNITQSVVEMFNGN